MARRVSWTNNSTGHTGTYVYRAATLDPQNLPAPVATVDPVAQGATAEWIDNEAPYGCYAVQDFDGQGVGTLSAEVCVTDPFAGVAVGDEVGGGIYAGQQSIGGTNFHIISGKAESEARYLTWKTSNTATPGTNDTDGLANTQAIQAAGLANHPACAHCVAYGGGGYTDWHMPARSQLTLIATNLVSHPEFSVYPGTFLFLWSSTEDTATAAWGRRLGKGTENSFSKLSNSLTTARPIRRVPV